VDPGTKLRGLLDSPKVCFEVDGVDADAQTGWSVLVKGRAAELSRAADLRAVADLPLRIWSIGPKGHWIRILPTEVTGREIHPRAAGSAPSQTPANISSEVGAAAGCGSVRRLRTLGWCSQWVPS